MILVTTHTNADFDSLACMAAARLLYPGAVCAFSGAAESLVRRFVKENETALPAHLSPKNIDLSEVERLVCVDVSSGERIGAFAALLDCDPPVPLDVYDHHPGACDLPAEREVLEEAGACISVMIPLLDEAGVEPSPFEATLFLLAIYEDTGFLSFPTTREADFQAVLRCLDWGGDLARVGRVLKRGLTEEQMGYLARALETLESVPVGGVRVHLCSITADRYIPDLSLLVHEIVSMEGLECLFFLAWMEGRVHVIARSRSPHVDVSSVLEVFGGGGHPSAASAVLKGRTLDEAKGLLFDEILSGRRVGMKAADIMNRSFQRIGNGATVVEAFRTMNRSRVNALPVFDGEELMGVVTRQEIDSAVQHGLRDSLVTDFVASEPPLLPSDTPVEEVRRRMLESNWRIVLFGGRDGRVEGLLSRMNLFKVLYRRDELDLSARAGGSPSAKEVEHLLRKAFSEKEVERLKRVGTIAEGLDQRCLLVGGAVRDVLLQRKVRDVDFVVEGDAPALAAAWAEEAGGYVRVHREFGTAVWVGPDGTRWDFATARAEYYETPAALPTVKHAALYQDLYRRDFTINALGLNVEPGHFGELLDLFGGYRDINAGRIRVLHGLSFVEDPTRAFRAVRFAVQLGFKLPPETVNLIASTLRQKVFDRLSPKRVLAEVKLILSGPNGVEGLRLMEKYGLLEVFNPSLKLTPKMMNTLYRVRKAVDFFETQFPGEHINKSALYLMALTTRFSNEDLESFRERYPFSQETRALLKKFRSVAWRAGRAMAGEAEGRAGRLYRVMKGERPATAVFLLARATGNEAAAAVTDYLSRSRFVKLEISGDDLLKAEIPPSPAIARGLEEALVAKIDGLVSTKEEELAVALETARSFGKGDSK